MRPALLHRAKRAPRRAQRGLTLIEITVAVLIAAVLFGAVVTGVGALTGTKAKAAAGELGGVIRSLYDSAALSGKTCRLVFQLPEGKDDPAPVRYRAECAEGNITTDRDRDEALKEENRRVEERKKKTSPEQQALRDRGFGNQGPTLQELLEQEKDRVDGQARFSAFTAPEVEPRELPNSVRISIWTQHQKEAVERGSAFLYFFPQGFTEKAMVFVRQGNNVWTITVAPLTGKTSVVAEELEVPSS